MVKVKFVLVPVSDHGVYLDLVSNKIECKERRLLEYSEEDVEVQF